MAKPIKLFIILCASAACIYAESTDTTAAQTLENTITLPAPTGTTVTPADNKIAKTGTTPPKSESSWSRIKDLFL